MTPRCDACRYWQRWKEIEGAWVVGLCHFNPPRQAFDIRNEIVTPWPQAKADDWCSRHQPVEALLPAGISAPDPEDDF